jgi:hypothetical protein
LSWFISNSFPGLRPRPMATTAASNSATIVDPTDQPISTKFWAPDSSTIPDDSSLDDIGVFQKTSASSDESGASDTQISPNPTSISPSASFDSKFSDSTDSHTIRLRHPQSRPTKPPKSVILPHESYPGALATPAIVSQDPVLADSWRRLFAKASRRPPTNLPDPPIPPTKYFQEYLNLIARTPNIPFGDSSMSEKTASLCRLYFININGGISSANAFLAFQDALESLLSNGVDIFGLPETNLDWLRHTVPDQCGKICNDFYGTSLLSTSTSSLRSNGTYKPGGTCTVLTQQYCGRHESSGSDPHGLGRWSFIRLNGKPGKSLVVVTAYRVCKASIGKAESSTAFHLEWHLLCLNGNLNPDPRKSAITDLIVEIERWKSEGAHVIWGSDFNENLGIRSTA